MLDREIKLFDDTAFRCSRLITKSYSTSFSLGISILSEKLRKPIYALYGFVRYADEIVDTFQNHDRKSYLDQFKEETYQAIERKISFNPVLHAFQKTVHQYQIDLELINAFLHSMEMDLSQKKFSDQDYRTYIYGSAEVVGLMCMKVFCHGDESLYRSLLEPARKLGAAFQKVNFLRDMKSDFLERGRVYFPHTNFKNFTDEDRRIIELDVQSDFDHAFQGIKMLPKGAKVGVYLAYVYYLKLFKKIKKTPTQTILHQRIRIPDTNKIVLLLKTYIQLRVFQSV